jgi:hypothetical protein
MSPPSVQRSDVFDSLKEFKEALTTGIRTTRCNLQQIVDMYTGRKKTVYENAYLNLQRYGLSSKHAVSSIFVKVEKVNPIKAPRVIQPRRPEYNLELGAYIKPLEHRLYKRIAKIFGDGPTVMKGYTVAEVATILHGKWRTFTRPVAVGLDACKFDMHVSPEMLEWEHSIYRIIFGQDEHLIKLLGWQMNNVGVGFAPDGKLKYHVKGKRFSGDMNTALGNCIIMCAMMWTWAKSVGVPIKLVNNGDDCVAIMEQEHLIAFTDGLENKFLKWGFRMTVEEPVYEFNQIEFCQMRPIFNGERYVMVRNIRTALGKDVLCTLPLTSESVARKWLGAVGECGLALCSGIPVLQSFYEAFIRNGVKPGKLVNCMQIQSGMRMMRGEMESKRMEVSDRARLEVFIAWGITPDEQRALEEHFNKWSFVWEPSDVDEEAPIFSILN